MKLFQWSGLVFVGMSLFAVVAAAREAKLVAVNGAVVVTGAKGEALTAAPGTIVPEGGSILTESGGEATVEFFEGTVSVIQPGSHVVLERHYDGGAGGKETTILQLEAGSVVTSLDPAKRPVTDFRVRTPKGEATAHGTIFAVKITQDNPRGTVTTMSGTVTFVTDQGEISVAFGHVSSGGPALSVADAVKANPSLAADILQATAGVARAVGQGSVGNTAQSPNLVTTVLAALVDVAVQAAPNNAADTVRTIVSAAGPALNPGQVKAVTLAAVQATAKVNPTAVGEVASAAAQAAGQTEGAPGGGPTNQVLPALDQTQVVVSPSRT